MKFTAALVWVAACSSAAFGATWYVDADSTGAGTGTSWADAFNTIADAVAAAGSAQDEIWVAEGVYCEAMSANRALDLGANVALYGGFAGTEDSREQRNASLHVTVIDGSQGDAGSPSETVVADEANNIIDGFTIRGGRGNIIYANTAGGGVILHVTSTISNCLITDNQSLWGGGLLVASAPASSESARITGCTFTHNTAVSGGALCAWAGSIIEDCLFEDNEAFSENLMARGGGIYVSGAAFTITNCIFNDNHATSGGGGLAVITGSGHVRACRFEGNFAGPVVAVGGAVLLEQGNPYFDNCIFIHNQVQGSEYYWGHGGAVSTGNSFSHFTNCTFYGNSATHNGGAVNACVVGGEGAMPPAYPCIITNCILWGDTPQEIYANPGNTFCRAPEVAYSCIEDGFAGEHNISTDPCFLDSASGDLELGGGSPCIGAGTSEGAPDEDYVGNPRPGWTAFDMGAYEYGAAPVADFDYALDADPDKPGTVHFTDLSLANGWTIHGWQWDFGDGHTSTDQNPVHTYTMAGSRNVTLRIDVGGYVSVTKMVVTETGVQMPAAGMAMLTFQGAALALYAARRLRKK